MERKRGGWVQNENEYEKKSKKCFFPHEVVQLKKWHKQKLTFNNVSHQLFISMRGVWWDDAACKVKAGHYFSHCGPGVGHNH